SDGTADARRFSGRSAVPADRGAPELASPAKWLERFGRAPAGYHEQSCRTESGSERHHAHAAELFADAATAAGDLGRGSADHLREPRQSPAGAWCGAADGTLGPARPGSQPGTPRTAI